MKLGWPRGRTPGTVAWLSVSLLALALVVVVVLALARRGASDRCGPNWVTLGPRCCAPGQHLAQGACAGVPSSCPNGFHRSKDSLVGCVVNERRVRYPGGSYRIGPNDWESETVLAETGKVGPFFIDATEVTQEQWNRCVTAGRCPELSVVPREPGLPVTQVTAEAAERFCTWVRGKLPTRAQWLALTAGATGSRFPWGQTGLVCRRAAFGLVRGPCAEGAVGPEWAGTRPEGANPLGVLDMVGNVAELVDEGNGTYSVRGGSYRSQVAADLKSWSSVAYRGPAGEVGLRCAYPDSVP